MLEEKIISSKEIKKRTIVSFLIFFVLIASAIFGWKWLNKQPEDNGVPQPLRAVLNTNEKIFSNFIFSSNNLTRSYPKSAVGPKTRVNGDAGMGNNFDASKWKLQVVRNPGDTLFLSLAEIKKLPKTEIIFDFKCIEGWSQVTHWGGVKFSDFAKAYGLTKQSEMQYVGLNTPDKEYYVGIDRKSILHPQTILCYEMNGQPLPMNQGYPLRLIIPVKYGVKHLKRIGTIFFSNQRPPDYWFERGYDYYCGL
ncbi:molybdopterin-dependent oxidoreductase [Ferruginibacter lapsinanis]|uniref:molybdopterin-dependent oxidoreductase n=1 Tax=Ferruginibacter lapsinanis TaxID=563172 RepID=UPI001E503877|nr:molybdopterin-dependent oxidoreductase [Ferruginibacter lapsinanis]UEG50145.1 molybdopterin-dependent oxidoreductase [Ferruginibacter lapsinanis]